MRPFTAISEVNLCAPVHELGVAALLLWYSVVPSSPSKPISLLPVRYQTIGSALPALLVEMGARLLESPPSMAPHQALDGMGGMPAAVGLSKSDMTALAMPPPGHCEPTPVEIAT